MARVVNVHEAKTHLSKLLDSVHAGEEIILAKAGRPYARLVPFEPARPRELGFIAGIGPMGDAVLEPLTDEELDAYEADV